MVTDLWLAQDGIAEGHAIIIDMEGSTLSHLARVNIIAMKKFMYYIQVNGISNWWKHFFSIWKVFFLCVLLGSIASSFESIPFH